MKLILLFAQLLFVSFHIIGQNKGIITNKISQDAFFNEKKGTNSSKDFLKKINRKYANTYIQVDYKTGDENHCREISGYGIDRKSHNSFKIFNKDISKTDAWVKFNRIIKEEVNNGLVSVTTKTERKCYVKYGESFTVQNLPSGKYKLTITHGKIWKQPLDTSNCSGLFMEQASVTNIVCSDEYIFTKFTQHTYTINNTIHSFFDRKTRKFTCKKTF